MTTFDRLLHAVLNRLFERRDIVINDRLYLRRWYLWGRGTGRQWFLHNIRLPDEGRDFHDHPWPFRTTILSGGYAEKVLYENSVHGAGDRLHFRGQVTTNLMAGFRHRILDVLPGTYTLVRAGRAVRDWGFWVQNDSRDDYSEVYRWVDHRTYLGLPADSEAPLEDRY